MSALSQGRVFLEAITLVGIQRERTDRNSSFQEDQALSISSMLEETEERDKMMNNTLYHSPIHPYMMLGTMPIPIQWNLR